MRYRRLGQTDLMVSELGIEVREVLGEGGPEREDRAVETLRAAIDGGITVFAWDVSDAAEDVEPLLVRAAGVDRGRLTLVAVLDHLPAAADLGPQVEAIASRLAEADAAGYLDVIAFPGLLDEAQSAALEEARGRDVVRLVAYAGPESDLPPSLPVDCVVLSDAPVAERDGVGVILRASSPGESQPDAPATSSVVASARDASEVALLLRPAV